MTSTRTDFPGSQGASLAARLDTPDAAPRAWALFAHCLTCSKDTKAAAHIARALVAAADWLRDAHGAPALLVGHSLGGAAVLAAAHRIPDARAVVTLGAPFDPAHVKHQFDDALPVIAERGRARVTLAGREFTITRAFVDDLNGKAQAERIRALRRPLLVMHAPHDRVVGIDKAAAIFQAALHPKSFVSLDGADHMLDRERDPRFAAGVMAAWAARYVE